MTRRGTRRRGRVQGTVVAVLLVLSFGVPASAFPEDVFGPTVAPCNDPSVNYAFIGTGWSGKTAAVEAAIADWEARDDYDGSRLWNAVPSSTPNLRFFLSPAPNGSASNRGYANCVLSLVELRDNLTGTELEHVARHEIG